MRRSASVRCTTESTCISRPAATTWRRSSGRGELEAATALGTVNFTKPVAFQEIDGRRVDVAARYALRSDDTYRLEVGDYDARHPLVIDPLLGSMFVGGSGLDRAYAIALERVVLRWSSGSVYRWMDNVGTHAIGGGAEVQRRVREP
jgi:hypothetical protein